MILFMDTDSGGGPTDPDFADVELLLHFDGADGSTTFTDSSSHGHTVEARVGAQIDTAQSQFGGASMLLNGSSDYARSNVTNGMNIRTNLWCTEGWFRFNEDPASNTVPLFCGGTSGYGGNNFYLLYISGTLYLGDGSTNNITAANAPSTGAWHHIAATFDGTTYRVFVDGTSVGSSTTLLASNAILWWEIGARTGEGWYLDGWIDDARITIGTARYTSNFTPPAAAFPNS